MKVFIKLVQRTHTSAIYEAEIEGRSKTDIYVSDFDTLIHRLNERDLVEMRVLDFAKTFGFEEEELELIFNAE